MDGAFPNQRGEPMDGRGRGAAGFRGNADNAKTKLCTRWMEGDCRFGDRCNFAHGEQELRSDAGGYPAGGGGRGYGGATGGRGGGRGYGRGDEGFGQGYPTHGGYAGGMSQPGYAGPPGGMPGGMPEDVWAAQGYPTPGPAGWYMYRVKESGESYFHNHGTGVTTWERPAEWPMGPPRM
eukprot:gene10582-12242_t